MTMARWPIVFLALILATLATAGLYTSARSTRETGPMMVMVIVSEVDIPARTDLDQLIKDDQFRVIQVPPGVVVDGVVTSIDELSHRRTRVAILAGEQIPIARIKA